MRIERVSENQIRCYLSREEMERRQLRLKELAYGTEKAKQLFSELMVEASSRLGFSADNLPVMIEAVPLHDDSLVLTVTRVDNPEELDTRFSSFAPFVKGGGQNARPAPPSPLRQLLETIRQDLEEGKEAETAAEMAAETEAMEPAGEAEPPASGRRAPVRGAAGGDSTGGRGAGRRAAADVPSGPGRALSASGAQLFTFMSLGRAADAAAAAAAAPVFHGKSSLYRDPSDSRYYLFLSPGEEASLTETSAAISVFSEFGTSEYITPAREQHLREHCDVICALDAVERLAGL